ncbi:MAG: ABC transporter substrate-binding protein, partial [Thermomicrobiales bacterium]
MTSREFSSTHGGALPVSRRQLISGTAAGGMTFLISRHLDGVSALAQDGSPEAGGGPLGGEIKMAYATPATLNPLFSTAGADQGVERQIYGALVAMTHEIPPQLDLAESVDISEDAREFTFHLREGLMFNDGVPLTSADVLFTF